MTVYIHPNAIVETSAIGDGTRIWAFAHVLPGAVIGKDCNICDHVFIENKVTIGDRVTIKSGVQLWDGVVIEDDVFIGPNATFTNDPFPRSKIHLGEYKQTLIRKNASIGANATILPGIEVGRNAMVGAGAVVTCNVPANAIVAGNPARIQGYCANNISVAATTLSLTDLHGGLLGVGKARVIELPVISDLRGSLSVIERDTQIPFEVRRVFFVYDVASKYVRGEHAHRTLHQLLICVAGSLRVALDDGANRVEIVLDRPSIGLYVPPMIWTVQYKFESETVLVVLASAEYDPQDYIRDYDEFLEFVKPTRQK